MPRRRSGRLVLVAVGVLVAALASVVGAMLVRRLRGGAGVTISEAAPAPAPRRRHPCLEDGLPRRAAAPIRAQPAAVAVVSVPSDAGARLYVADTVRGVCLGIAVRAEAGRWNVLVPDSVRSVFEQPATDAARAGTAPSADAALRALLPAV